MNTHVNFELAKLLKEKSIIIYSDYQYTDFNGVERLEKNVSEIFPYAPTIAEVAMWLYEKHGVWVCVYIMDKWMPNGNDKEQLFDYSIKQIKFGLIDIPKKPEEFNSPTEAYQEAINYTLKNLIK